MWHDLQVHVGSDRVCFRKPTEHGENIEAWLRNQGPLCCEVTVLSTNPPCDPLVYSLIHHLVANPLIEPNKPLIPTQPVFINVYETTTALKCVKLQQILAW